MTTKPLLNIRKDSFDARDHVCLPSIAILRKLTMRSSVPYIKDQGNEGSCLGNAGSEHLELMSRLHVSNIPASYTRPDLRFSPQFLYAMARLKDGDFNQDNGTDTRTIFKVLTESGCCPEAIDPYASTNMYALPTDLQKQSAANFKFGAYHRILDVETAKSVLQSRYSFLVALPLYQQVMSDQCSIDGLVGAPGPRDTPIGMHGMHVIGFDDGKKVFSEIGAFEVQNSWSDSWGDHGYCWVPYRYFTLVGPDTFDMWVGHFGSIWKPKVNTNVNA